MRVAKDDLCNRTRSIPILYFYLYTRNCCVFVCVCVCLCVCKTGQGAESEKRLGEKCEWSGPFVGGPHTVTAVCVCLCVCRYPPSLSALLPKIKSSR